MKFGFIGVSAFELLWFIQSLSAALGLPVSSPEALAPLPAALAPLPAVFGWHAGAILAVGLSV
jgi:hypothetical protein